MSSNRFCLKLNFLQCFMCLLLLWPANIHSFPSSNLALNDRYERDTSGTEFPQNGSFELVLNDHESDSLEFKVCCNRNDGCNGEKFTFCFPTTSSNPPQIATVYHCDIPKTCAYQIIFMGVKSFGLFATPFTTTSTCFIGKISSDGMYADSKQASGCPLKFDTKKRFIINILNNIPDGVTVTATNAKEYVEPTTLPPTTFPSTEELQEAEETTKKESSATGATTPEAGMSDALKFSLIGVGIFVFLLIVGGIAFAIYWFCFKKKKSSKPVPPVTVPKTAAAVDAPPATQEAAAHVNDKTFEPKQKTTTENETTKDAEHSKQAAPSNIRSKNAAAAPSNVVSSSAAAAETPPPPSMASKDFTASREPKNNSDYSKTDASKLNKTDDQSPFDNDESGRDGKSTSKKCHGQTSFSKEVAAALDKTKIKKMKAIK